VPVQFDLPLSQDTVVTTQAPVPLNTHATFSLGQFGSINGMVSLQLPAGTRLPVHLDITVPVSNVIPVVFDQPVRIPLAEKGLIRRQTARWCEPIIGVGSKCRSVCDYSAQIASDHGFSTAREPAWPASVRSRETRRGWRRAPGGKSVQCL
jgi:hypothetical protein